MSETELVTRRPDGSQPRWLNRLGHVTPPQYSSTYPGGHDVCSAVLNLPAEVRTEALNPGRILQAVRGGSIVWDGKLDEPSPAGQDGWQISGTGLGHAGDDYAAVYTTWTNQNDAVNQAITRGLRWTNPGISGSVWLGQQQDSGALTITDLLNLFCTQGGFGWRVDRWQALQVAALPSTPTRVLVCTVPVPRTLGGDINTIWIRYQSSADGASAAVYGLTSVTNSASINLHGPMETYLDLSSAGQKTSGQAQAVGNAILNRYIRASYAGSFTVRRGELLTIGGTPVDLGCELAGEVVRLILADGGYGGEVTPGPTQFIVGAYNYDNATETATVTPFESIRHSIPSLISEVGLGHGGTAIAERRQARRKRHPPHARNPHVPHKRTRF